MLSLVPYRSSFNFSCDLIMVTKKTIELHKREMLQDVKCETYHIYAPYQIIVTHNLK